MDADQFHFQSWYHSDNWDQKYEGTRPAMDKNMSH